MLLIWLACQSPPPPITAPDTHSWDEEGELVIQGLHQVEVLWDQKQPEAARMMAERVYTERWEPQLEPACREMDGPEKAMAVEYDFGLLLNDLKGNPSRDKVDQRIQTITQAVRKVATNAHLRYPPIGEHPTAPNADAAPSRPIVPQQIPNWERDAHPEEP
jgi:hypothetical protein